MFHLINLSQHNEVSKKNCSEVELLSGPNIAKNMRNMLSRSLCASCAALYCIHCKNVNCSSYFTINTIHIIVKDMFIWAIPYPTYFFIMLRNKGKDDKKKRKI